MRTSAYKEAPTPPWKRTAEHRAAEHRATEHVTRDPTHDEGFDTASNWERLRAELHDFEEDSSLPDDPYTIEP